MRRGGRSWRVRPGEPLPSGLGPLAIVTAFNPASHPAARADNRAALRALRASLDAVRAAWLPARAHGTGPHARRWDEPGFALTGPAAAELAVALGAALGQNAVLVAAAPGAVHLVATRDGFAGRRPGDLL